MIYGNKIGGDSSEKTYIITNEDEGIILHAVVVDEVTEFDAQCKDVAAGKKFVGEGGASVGTNDVSPCRIIHGIREISQGTDVILTLNQNDMWNYSYLQGFISTKKNPYNPIMLIINDEVYENGEKISDITKNGEDDAIYFNVINNSNDIYLLNYVICKEEQ